MPRVRWRYLPLVVLVLFAVAGTLLLLHASPQEWVAMVGDENAYALLFGLALVSGLSLFGATPYHLVLITLAVGGLNPWLLGLAAASGVMIGDTISYAIGHQGRVVLPPRAERMADRISGWLSRYPRLVPFFFFTYGAIAPFSNDLVGVTMGVARYPFVRVMVPLGLGNLVFNVVLAFLATHVERAFL